LGRLAIAKPELKALMDELGMPTTLHAFGSFQKQGGVTRGIQLKLEKLERSKAATP
jgi:hypothetical protein